MNTTVAASASFVSAASSSRLYGRLWRWHFFAAFIVIPFVLWQSITGSLYLWSERWIDFAYPTLRFVQPGSGRVPLSEQIAAALQATSYQGHIGTAPTAAAARNGEAPAL